MRSNVHHRQRVAADGRFAIHRQLGSGGMGIVYEAHDRERDEVVAVKTLRRLSASTLYRFKREFRSIADLVHPNLVQLHELVSLSGEWYVTMELIRGVEFLSWVRPHSPGPPPGKVPRGKEVAADAENTAMTRSITDDSDGGWLLGSGLDILEGELDMARLRSSFEQLSVGVDFIHRASKLHRDLKPSNVLVTRDGRVVICDFGLVIDLDRAPAELTDEHFAVGTAAYMSPEQVASGQLTPASDWYSVGVMLYQALTGELPFVGTAKHMMAVKQRDAPVSPEQRVAGLPPDLCSLCMDLLSINPKRRPKGDGVLRRLGSTSSGMVLSSQSRGAAFIGRQSHLAQLERGFARTVRGGAVNVRVSGSSGLGKSALIRRFLTQLAPSDAVVLSGRCYERESVPFKALDTVIDSLSSWLLKRGAELIEDLLPEDFRHLARLFPVLQLVESVSVPRRLGFEHSEPQELRRLAFAALRELLGRIASRHPLVLWIDDLQWVDVDSAALLGDLIGSDDWGAHLLITSFRTEGPSESKQLRDLLGRAPATETLDIEVSALDPADACELAFMLGADSVTHERAAAIAREAQGNPYFVQELIHFLRDGIDIPATTGFDEVSLDRLLGERIVRLDSDARIMLSTIAVAGRPVARSLIRASCEISGSERLALSALRAERLIRTGGMKHDDLVETYHDRVREAAVARLDSATVRSIHRRLAVALNASGQTDAEALVEHWLGAGDRDQAAAHAVAAAEQAAAALAFDRAARLYRIAAEPAGLDAADRRRLQVKLGESLANAGRGAESAEAYLAASLEADAATHLDLRRRAAEQLLRSGHFDGALAAFSDVLAAVGLELAPTPRRALLSLIARRLRLRLRGFRYRERDPSQLSAEQLTHIDICWVIATGMGMIDTIRGADFQARHLLRALSAGEPVRVARGFALEAAYIGIRGRRHRERADALALRAEAIAKRTGNAHAVALAIAVRGVNRYMSGEWGDALALCEEAEDMFQLRCAGVAWELHTVRFFAVSALAYLGDLRRLEQRMRVEMREASERGDLYAQAAMRSCWTTNLIWLLADDHHEAERQIDEAQLSWSDRGFHVQHFYELMSRTHIALYRGDGHACHQAIEARWRELEHSMLLRVQTVRIEMMWARGRAAVAAGASNRRAMKIARRQTRGLYKEGVRWAEGLGKTIEAAILCQAARREDAIICLQSAIESFGACNMHMHAANAQRRLGELTAGARGDALVATADDWMRSRGTTRPDRLCEVLAPGFPEQER